MKEVCFDKYELDEHTIFYFSRINSLVSANSGNKQS